MLRGEVNLRRSVNSKQRRPSDDADTPPSRLPPPADPQENVGASASESPTPPDPSLTLARTQYPALVVGNTGNRKPLTYAVIANPCNPQQLLTAHS
jgi:hypothetical protein